MTLTNNVSIVTRLCLHVSLDKQSVAKSDHLTWFDMQEQVTDSKGLLCWYA